MVFLFYHTCLRRQESRSTTCSFTGHITSNFTHFCALLYFTFKYIFIYEERKVNAVTRTRSFTTETGEVLFDTSRPQTDTITILEEHICMVNRTATPRCGRQECWNYHTNLAVVLIIILIWYVCLSQTHPFLYNHSCPAPLAINRPWLRRKVLCPIGLDWDGQYCVL